MDKHRSMDVRQRQIAFNTWVDLWLFPAAFFFCSHCVNCMMYSIYVRNSLMFHFRTSTTCHSTLPTYRWLSSLIYNPSLWVRLTFLKVAWTPYPWMRSLHDSVRSMSDVSHRTSKSRKIRRPLSRTMVTMLRAASMNFHTRIFWFKNSSIDWGELTVGMFSMDDLRKVDFWLNIMLSTKWKTLCVEYVWDDMAFQINWKFYGLVFRVAWKFVYKND